MRNSQGVGFLFSATDMVSGTMQRMGRNYDATMRGMGASSRNAAGKLTAFNEGTKVMAKGVAGLVAVKVAATGVSKAMDLADAAGSFEAGMAQVAAISNVAVDSEEAVMLSTTAMDAALKTKFSPREAADGLANFAAQGFSAEQQAKALVPALRLAQGGMIGVDSSAAAMTSALKVFSLDVGQAGIVTDKLLKIANLTSLQAADLELALGTVGRGAGAAKQNIDEMLISMGLVKNTGVDASVAASSVSSALIFMAKNSDTFKDEFGVSVTDANGKFRDFIDVVMDTELNFADKFSDDAERVKASAELYGRFGLTAFQAISGQINSGIKTATGGIVKGREAVEYLRQTMRNAEGTAADFEAKMLGTFEGQKQLLEGVTQGLEVAVGQPFLAIFKPMITTVREFVENAVGIINAIPPGVKEVLAGTALAVLALGAAIGTFIALRAGIQLAGMALRYFGMSASVAMGPLLITIGVVTALGLAIAAFSTRSSQLKGGLGGIFDIGRKIKVFFQGLVQYFKDGELSGAVLDELNKTENEGIKNFLGRVLDFGDRVLSFFDGVKIGFAALVEAAQPAFDEFSDSMAVLGDTVGDFMGSTDDAFTQGSSATQSQGMQIGMWLGRAAILVVEGLTLVVKIVSIVLGVLDSLGISIGTAIKSWIAFKVAVAASTAIQAVPAIMSGISAAMGVFTAATASATAVVPALTAGMATLSASASGFLALLMGPVGLVLGIGALVAALVYLADQKFGFSDEISNWIGDITDLNAEMARLNAEAGGITDVRGFGGESPFAGGRTAQLAAEAGMGIEEYQQQRINELSAEGWDAKINPETGDVEIVGKARTAPASPSVATQVDGVAATAPVAAGEQEFNNTSKQIAELSVEIDKLAKRPVQVDLHVDGEKIGEAAAQGQAASGARAFAPMPVEG